LFKAKIRGIYSTALTKLLLDEGLTIVQPSIEIEERFHLPKCEEQPDIEIHDKIDYQGIVAIGSSNSIEAICNLLSKLDDAVIRKYPFTLNGVYKGFIKSFDPRLKMAIVDIGVSEGLLGIKMEKPQGKLKEGGIIVQVIRANESSKIPILSDKIKLSGKYLSIVLDGSAKLDEKINNYDLSFKSFKIAKELNPQGLRIFLNPSALNQPLEALKDEAKSLIKTWQFIVEKAKREEAPTILMEGKQIVEVEFPWLSKKELDRVRRTVVPTVENHHYYKAYGKNLALEVDVAEKLLKEGKPNSEVEASLKRIIEEGYPHEGSIISIEHVKLDGSVLSLGKAEVVSFDKKELKIELLRIIRSNGLYDGLDILKEFGDIAISEAKLGEWYLKTRYYSKNRVLKGTYINFNTPIELYYNKIRYIDLEIDLSILPNGQVKILDEDKFKEAIKNGILNEKVSKIIDEKIKEVLKTL
jgi:Ribonuclease G/E